MGRCRHSGHSRIVRSRWPMTGCRNRTGWCRRSWTGRSRIVRSRWTAMGRCRHSGHSRWPMTGCRNRTGWCRRSWTGRSRIVRSRWTAMGRCRHSGHSRLAVIGGSRQAARMAADHRRVVQRSGWPEDLRPEPSAPTCRRPKGSVPGRSGDPSSRCSRLSPIAIA